MSRRAVTSILVEFWSVWTDGRKTFIVGLDLLQAPAIGETVKFAKAGAGHQYVVTSVEWFVGLTDKTGKTIEPGPDGLTFQTAIVEVRPA